MADKKRNTMDAGTATDIRKAAVAATTGETNYNLNTEKTNNKAKLNSEKMDQIECKAPFI